jgi:hypothetical protein
LALNISGLNLVQTIPRHHEHRQRSSHFKQEKRLIVVALADVDGAERYAGPPTADVSPRHPG